MILAYGSREQHPGGNSLEPRRHARGHEQKCAVATGAPEAGGPGARRRARRARHKVPHSQLAKTSTILLNVAVHNTVHYRNKTPAAARMDLSSGVGGAPPPRF